MHKENGQVLLTLEKINLDHSLFRGSLTRRIIFEIWSNGGVFEMRLLFRRLDVTAAAARQRLKELECAGILSVATDHRNKRCKIVTFTEEGRTNVLNFQRIVEAQIGKWKPEAGAPASLRSGAIASTSPWASLAL